MNTSETVIPQEYVEFFKKVAVLAAQANLRQVSMKIAPGFGGSGWHSDINMHWDRGRHGDAVHKLHITSEVIVRTEVS